MIDKPASTASENSPTDTPWRPWDLSSTMSGISSSPLVMSTPRHSSGSGSAYSNTSSIPPLSFEELSDFDDQPQNLSVGGTTSQEILKASSLRGLIPPPNVLLGLLRQHPSDPVLWFNFFCQLLATKCPLVSTFTPSVETKLSPPPATMECQICHKTYSQMSNLKLHIRTHTLPCRCSYCGKAFSRKWLLKGHERTHTGERPYSCHVCSRSFADRSNLRAHMQTHQKVKRYKCHKCPRSFSRLGLLQRHVLSGKCDASHGQ
ncbi:unnamed protein product [Mesocestoides corti]|uniref:Snail family zinc finger 1b n=1 Tax=Mesocestoides corti TaxID=53468 RepID=A0A0R3URS2_MESCO|nr:unnamed protein product [Mesocestoides corti]